MTGPDDNFLAALQAEWQPPKQEYRAYYNENGWVEFTTGSGFPESGNYIVITKEEYINHPAWNDLKVIDGRLVKVDIRPGYRIQLTRSSQGYCTVKGHASLLIQDDETYNSVEYYAKRTN